MKHNIYLFILQFLIIDFGLWQSNVKALIGHNVRPVLESEFPSVACLLKYDPNSEYDESMYCTGSFISLSLILTAEHCTKNLEIARMEIVVGHHNMTNAMRFYPIWWLSFDQWMSQLGRTNTRRLNDILLIKIFGLTYDIIPTTIAGFSSNRNINGYQVQLVGCGLTNTNTIPSILHTAVVNIVDIHRCLQIITHLSGEIYPVLEQIICSKGNPYTFLEYGDSGGPLFYQGNLMAINIAVCPKMDGGFHSDKLNIHISIEPYREFLNSIYNS